ncbi:MAG: ATP phosphoribosyltransferase [Pseudomonadota bacterium]
MLSIGIASKGRIEDQSFAYLASIGIPVTKAGAGRSYAAEIKGLANTKVWLLPADEIAKRLHAGTLHAGITGLDLLHEHGALDARVLPLERLGFARADLVVAVPRTWIDVVDTGDLLDVFGDLRARLQRAPKVATKYRRITKSAFSKLGLRDFRIIADPGATEAAPARGSADVIVDITTSGETLRANQLKPLGPALLASEAVLAASLTAPDWSEEGLAALGRILDRIASHGDDHKLIEFSVGGNTAPLARDLKARFGLELQAAPDDTRAALFVAEADAFEVAAFLRGQTQRPVSVLDLAYRLSETGRPLGALKARLKD